MYKRSRFNVVSETDLGELIVYNSYSGAIALFDKEEAEKVHGLLTKGASGETHLEQQLVQQGFLVSSEIDEKRRATFLHQTMHRTDSMHLVILPTESCNFRCTYCYEDFPRGKMTEKAKQGLKNYVQQQGKYLKQLTVSWFGGEPLLADDVINELSETFLQVANEQDFVYSAEVATNGYLLTKDRFEQLLKNGVQQVMVTIDGNEVEHNQRRKLANGEGSFATIFENLRSLKEVEGDFEITLRTNFDEESLAAMPDFISSLKANFGDDPRFKTYFRPVARWGGKNDECLPVCDRNTIDEKIWEFTEKAIEEGLPMSALIAGSLQPTASVCYAAKPNSFIIASDAQIFKCTLAFDAEENQLGTLEEDGTLNIDYDKVALWTTSGEETDENCQSCFFRPACQGNHCPFYRKATGDRPCSHEKRQIKKVLSLIAK
ncbi:radical SAM/SPASM domain-containing protein [Anaerobacillus arseniciselenatis]|uniref:Radical SAM/SPASM domain-containing protein n=1 Tax=Anaerobacillus arseniciselenatis TaxID=85682 RepID=A0A1S2LQW9_9BACI|nr:radical SAM protein [Anaerobacillus arseniciselenatis]OIJ13785.1 radical SAM/SPASM domain-containing protein [Anaerobacillus arseniciselenatis]